MAKRPRRDKDDDDDGGSGGEDLNPPFREIGALYLLMFGRLCFGIVGLHCRLWSSSEKLDTSTVVRCECFAAAICIIYPSGMKEYSRMSDNAVLLASQGITYRLRHHQHYENGAQS